MRISLHKAFNFAWLEIFIRKCWKKKYDKLKMYLKIANVYCNQESNLKMKE